MDMKNIDDQFDELWSAALEQSYQIEVPDPGPSWKVISKKLEDRKKMKRRLKRLRRGGAVAAAFLVGAMLFSVPLQTKAYLPVMKIVKNVGGGISSIFYGDTEDDPKKAVTSAPPGFVETKQGDDKSAVDSDSNSGEYGSVDEAQKSVPYPILKPTYVPDAYRLTKVSLIQAVYLTLLYKDDTGKIIIVTQNKLTESERIGNAEGNENTKSVLVNGNDGLIITNKASTKITWVQSNFTFSIMGALSEQELIDMAKSMR
ncbi:DUF4367 domain-containing protein [Gorillibacterium massiliense]|uniref:DUF4367 domain-containing protein n=1 Tax=Gorillibacterium massiliense TaxID=1280390 RepID=UPI0004B54D74|nr:DUF4367 domain-containing protein [Gorillibacterium massiliense]